MTIRDMCCAGIDIQGRVQVICWILDEYKKVFFDDYADHIGDQEWLDMEIKYMYSSEDGAMVFELEAEDALAYFEMYKDGVCSSSQWLTETEAKLYADAGYIVKRLWN